MENNCYGISDDYLDEDDDGVMYSTKNYYSDSDNEDLSAFLSRKCKKKSKLSGTTQKEDDDDSAEDVNELDDFEKEMAAELNATMKKLTTPNLLNSKSFNEEDATGENTHYDKIYFDSDEEDNSTDPNTRKDKHKVISNDDLFYDPLMDDEDQAWVDNNRRNYQLKSKRIKTKDGKLKTQALPQSDAVLNCPACFTTLCLDCQRHEIYKNQYRAMFVFNCTVDKSERLHFAVKEDKKKKFKSRNKKPLTEEDKFKMETNQDASSSQQNQIENKEKKDEIFYSVRCTLCNTKIAVQDETEVYHFFNVLTSY